MSDSVRRVAELYLKRSSIIPAGVKGATNTALQKIGLDGGASFSSVGEALLLAGPIMKRYGWALSSPFRLGGARGREESSLLFKGQPDPASLFRVSWLRNEAGSFEVIAFLL